MRIAVFGATGMAGSATVAEALDRGHHVIAASRNTSAETTADGQLSSQSVDVANEAAVAAILATVDAAVFTIRIVPESGERLARLTRQFLDAAKEQSTRVLIIGGAAPLRSPSFPERLLVDDSDFVPTAWRDAAHASLTQFQACKEHPYDGWIYLSPPAILERGVRTGLYRRGTTALLVDDYGISRISAADLAIAVIDELDDPSDDFHFTVAESV